MEAAATGQNNNTGIIFSYWTNASRPELPRVIRLSTTKIGSALSSTSTERETAGTSPM
jgi:hypothetical protein